MLEEFLRSNPGTTLSIAYQDGVWSTIIHSVEENVKLYCQSLDSEISNESDFNELVINDAISEWNEYNS